MCAHFKFWWIGLDHFNQWRIQDFPDGGANLQGGGTNLLFDPIFPDNCNKTKEFEPRGEEDTSLAPP